MTKAEMFLLYVYNKEGYHTGGMEVPESGLEMIFRTIVRKAKEEKRKVIITDMADLCVYHMENGEVIFPTSEMYASS